LDSSYNLFKELLSVAGVTLAYIIVAALLTFELLIIFCSYAITQFAHTLAPSVATLL